MSKGLANIMKQAQMMEAVFAAIAEVFEKYEKSEVEK